MRFVFYVDVPHLEVGIIVEAMPASAVTGEVCLSRLGRFVHNRGDVPACSAAIEMR